VWFVGASLTNLQTSASQSGLRPRWQHGKSGASLSGLTANCHLVKTGIDHGLALRGREQQDKFQLTTKFFVIPGRQQQRREHIRSTQLITIGCGKKLRDTLHVC
jgi:hypothetical protein